MQSRAKALREDVGAGGFGFQRLVFSGSGL